MIGLSLSVCVMHIIDGRVALEDVEKIISATCFANEDEMEEVISHYQETYWREDPERATSIVRMLWANGKIEQPRLEGKPTHYIYDGCWVNSESEIKYE